MSKTLMQKINTLKKTNFSRPQLTLFITIFALIGGYLIYRSFATAPLVASLEAEQMTLPTTGTIVLDANASAGKAAFLPANATATGSVNFPSSVTSLSLIARGNQCQGAPTMTVKLDGTSLLTNQAVSSTSWNSYAATPTTAINSGAHSLSVSFTNDNTYSKRHGHTTTTCSRDLYLDVTSFYGPTLPPPPAPTVSLSATPTSVTAGQSSTLNWNSTNSNSCTASGVWGGSQATAGSASTGALNQTSTYNLTCTGTGGSAVASVVITVTAATGGNKLTWAPPTLSNPVDVTIADTGCAACNSIPGQDSALPWVVSLDPAKDYRLHINHRTGLHGLSVSGGHNVVIVGGSITADADYGSFATGLVIQDFVGTFHIEGMDIGGQYMGDAIRVQHNSNIAVQSTSSSVIQVENCRLFSQVAPGHTINENHPDAFQVGYQFPGQIRFDKVTMNIGYQGFTFGPAGAEGVGNGVYINRTNGHMHLDTDGSSPNVYLFQQDEATAAIHTDDQFWGEPYSTIGVEGLLSPGFFDGRVGIPNTSADKPVIGNDTSGKYVTYPSSANIAGKIRQGIPPGGDFVPSGSVGVNYVSPGYL